MSALAETMPTEMPAPILFTDSAAAKVADLIAEEGNTDLKLRVFVTKWRAVTCPIPLFQQHDL